MNMFALFVCAPVSFLLNIPDQVELCGINTNYGLQYLGSESELHGIAVDCCRALMKDGAMTTKREG